MVVEVGAGRGQQHEDVGEPGRAAFGVGDEADVGRLGAQRAREMVARGGDVWWHDNPVDEPVFVAMRADNELRGVFGMLFVGILQDAGPAVRGFGAARVGLEAVGRHGRAQWISF